MAQIALGVLWLLVMAALVFEIFLVYFTLGGPAPEATEADGVRYLVTAGIGLAVAAASLVLAVARKHGVAFFAALLLALGMTGLAWATAVPQGRWTPAPADNRLPDDYVPCFSGSYDCPGG